MSVVDGPVVVGSVVVGSDFESAILEVSQHVDDKFCVNFLFPSAAFLSPLSVVILAGARKCCAATRSSQ